MNDIEALLSLLQRAADCRRRRVAAVLVLDGEVVGRGWNGLRSGSCAKGACPRGLLTYDEQPAFVGYQSSGCTALHAEASALLEAGDRALGATCHITCEPCIACYRLLTIAGVRDIVVHPASTEQPAATRL